METFENLKATLEELERSCFGRLNQSFRAADGVGDCITGAIQFFALDRPRKPMSLKPMPVVCTVGINYTQEPRNFAGKLRPWFEGRPSMVVENTNCRAATSYVIAAYNRNAAVWSSRPAFDPSPLGFYAALNATAKSELLSGEPTEVRERFNLMMTNVSPFITQKQWSDQVKSTPDACKAIVKDVSHLDALYEACGAEVDLWIGHSANQGTTWVWPCFADFVRRHNIKNWIVTGNISSRAHLYFNGEYRKATNPRFPWFGPEPKRAAATEFS